MRCKCFERIAYRGAARRIVDIVSTPWTKHTRFEFQGNRDAPDAPRADASWSLLDTKVGVLIDYCSDFVESRQPLLAASADAGATVA
jgi:hypothetical protein